MDAAAASVAVAVAAGADAVVVAPSSAAADFALASAANVLVEQGWESFAAAHGPVAECVAGRAQPRAGLPAVCFDHSCHHNHCSQSGLEGS